MTAPVTLLIAALGGEGGGVLTSWIVNAAKMVYLKRRPPTRTMWQHLLLPERKREQSKKLLQRPLHPIAHKKLAKRMSR